MSVGVLKKTINFSQNCQTKLNLLTLEQKQGPNYAVSFADFTHATLTFLYILSHVPSAKKQATNRAKHDKSSQIDSISFLSNQRSANRAKSIQFYFYPISARQKQRSANTDFG